MKWCPIHDLIIRQGRGGPHSEGFGGPEPGAADEDLGLGRAVAPSTRIGGRGAAGCTLLDGRRGG
jgi:hypothetical protein